MKDIEHLYALKEKVIVRINQEISTTYPIGDTNEDKILTEIPLVLSFECYTRFIYNSWSITGDCKNFKDLIGKKIISIDMENSFLVLKSNVSCSIKVDISDDGFNGPESLVLYGSNNSIVVWN